MLRLENLSVEVDGRRILNNINLHIKEGEVHVLFGPNGTGKSTLVGAIIGFKKECGKAKTSREWLFTIRYKSAFR